MGQEILRRKNEINKQNLSFPEVERTENYFQYIKIYENLQEGIGCDYFQESDISPTLIENNELSFKKSNKFVTIFKISLVSIYLFIFYVIFIFIRRTPKIRNYLGLARIRKYKRSLKSVGQSVIRQFNSYKFGSLTQKLIDDE